MTQKAIKPDNFPWITPYLTVKDVDKAIAFYERAFDFKLKDKPAEQEGEKVHAELTHKTEVVMIGKEGAFGKDTQSPLTQGVPSPVSIYVYCDDVDALFERAKSEGAVVSLAPEDTFWGDRMCALKDIDGHRWSFATQIPK